MWPLLCVSTLVCIEMLNDTKIDVNCKSFVWLSSTALYTGKCVLLRSILLWNLYCKQNSQYFHYMNVE